MTKLIQFIIIIGIILMISTSCKEESTGINYGEIQGKVIDSDSFEAIENAQITTLPPSSAIRTNVIGFYYIKNILPGQYEITVTKVGYRTKSVLISVLSGKVTYADITLEKINGNPDDEEDEQTKKSLIAHYNFDNNLVNVINPNSNFSGSGYQFVNDRKNNNNSAIKFIGNSNSYATTNKVDIFNLSKFTYSFWLKPENGYGEDYNGYIDIISRWGNWGVGQQSFAFCLSTTGKIQGMTYSAEHDTPSHPTNYSYFESNKSIMPNIWSHVAISYSNSNLKLYINGVLNESVQVVKPQFFDIYGLTIGKRPNDNQISNYNGALDDLKIYNTALSDSQIYDLSTK